MENIFDIEMSDIGAKFGTEPNMNIDTTIWIKI